MADVKLTAPTEEDLRAIARRMQVKPWGIGSRIEDVTAYARAVLRIHGAADETAMIDAAMAEMSNIYPPLRRSECARLIRAALGAAIPPTPGSAPFERWRKELRACIVQLLYVAHESKSPTECKDHPRYSDVMRLIDGGPSLATLAAGVTAAPAPSWRTVLTELLEVVEARNSQGGGFKANPEGQRRIDAAKALLATGVAESRKLDPNRVQICRVAPITYDNGQPCICPEGTCNLWKGGLSPAGVTAAAPAKERCRGCAETDTRCANPSADCFKPAPGVTPAEVQSTARCGYCAQDMIPGSECRTSASASACAMYEQHAATHKIDATGVALPRTDELVEAVAKAIYSQWVAAPGYVRWVEGGNSLNQDDARRLARKALEEAGIDGVPGPDHQPKREEAP